jgi:hypothetical protein
MDDEMKTVKWYCSIGLVGCRITGTIEVEADATDDDIDEMIREEVMQRLEWGRADA